ncbi:hypothetical protein THAOC_22958 [Thalassiosira oceanica]|uniref:B30.2/SPRY domain-containing protein n=1 Tax=Thalassiosira oceanica TaxID=159749 RepID=K0RX71_THAOC|nr:hypothetical protein THAOC_22958 [Thalassiosira oceanica]|eukprot:EJK57044.1 hypothetical protein THAOC_22958 [Thalassiosira oceanica]
MADDRSSKRPRTTSRANGESTFDDARIVALESEIRTLRLQLLRSDAENERLRGQLQYFEGRHEALPVVTIKPTVDISRLDTGLVTHIVSFLGTSLELRNLALTCKAFGWQQPATGLDLSLAEQVARQVVCSGRNDVEGARITLSPYVRGTTTWLLILRESERPLKFDTLLGRGIEHTNERTTSFLGDNTNTLCTAVASHYVMESGIHYAEFQITEGNPFIGIVRPIPNLDPDSIVRPMPNLDPGRYDGHFSFYDRSMRDDFLAARTVEWGTGNVHMCDYDCGNGAMSWTSWDNEGEDFAEWDGMEGCDAGDAVGMLINLDEGALVVYKNNRRLGVMKDGLSGSYCWCAYDSGTSALTIERCDPPLA